ncbi:MAG: diacylglycerol/lipid kinase family protein [Myxococcaceae bacterium]
MVRLGSGKGVAVLFNGRAKQVTPRVVRAMAHALPDATVLVSNDRDQARRHVEHIALARPDVVLSGGGDGSVTMLLNLLRDTGHLPFPAVGALPLGTGNAWANNTGAGRYFKLVKRLSVLPKPLPCQRFDLVEMEGQFCPFGGVGWDARVLNDYARNLDKRSSQLFGSRIATRIHKGLGGYLYAISRLSIPEEIAGWRRDGQPRCELTNLGREAYIIDGRGKPIQLATGESARSLYDGPVSVLLAATLPEWGFSFRVAPFAREMPGHVNVRVYDRPALEAVRNLPRLWRGAFPMAGAHDFFVTHARVRFSRPMPFQMGGDPAGVRDSLEFKVGKETVEVVDWRAATALAGVTPS